MGCDRYLIRRSLDRPSDSEHGSADFPMSELTALKMIHLQAKKMTLRSRIQDPPFKLKLPMVLIRKSLYSP